MTITWIIGILLFAIGMIGLQINVRKQPDWYNMKYHLYSTIPTIIGLLLLLISIFSLK